MDITVFLNNIYSIVGQICASLIGIGAFIFFTYNVISKRFSAVASVGALACVFIAAFAFVLIPSAIKSGQNSGKKVGGGGGTYGLVSAPSPLADVLDAHGLALTKAA